MNLNDYSDDEIEEAWIQGLAYAYRLAKCKAIVDDSPEDLVQEVFTKLDSGKRSLPEDLPLNEVVTNVIRSHADNALKKQRTRLEYTKAYRYEPSAEHNMSLQNDESAGYNEISHKETLNSLVEFLGERGEGKCIKYVLAIDSNKVSPSNNIDLARLLVVTESEIVNIKKRFKRLVTIWWKKKEECNDE